MTSAVEICNLALSDIRAGSINSLDESSVQAQQCKLKYPILRDRCLREIPWQFNHKIAPLAPVTTDIFNYAYAYQYPSDCLSINRLLGRYEEIPTGEGSIVAREWDARTFPLKDLRRQIPYEVFNFDNNKVIGADMPELRVDYAAKVSDPNLFSGDFILALSHLLASEIAIPIIGAEMGRALRTDSLTLYREYMDSALASDLNDQYHLPEDSDFVTVRR